MSTSTRPRSRSTRPSLREERGLLREGRTLVAGVDEVGRGALAGPVSVGVVVVSETTGSAPTGVRDSKLLLPAVRESLAPRVRRWAHDSAVGHASPQEIDEYGILAALRLAALRALAACRSTPDIVILDGKHDWLTGRESEPDVLFDIDPRPVPAWPDVVVPPVRTRIKADMTCSSVAAASIIAKVERDAQMVAWADRHPEYGWAVNKGYAAPDHRAALLQRGPCDLHRRSWNLLGARPTTEDQESPEAAGEDGPCTGRGPAMGHDGAVKVRLT